MKITTVLVEQVCVHFAGLDGVKEVLHKMQRPTDNTAKKTVSCGERSQHWCSKEDQSCYVCVHASEEVIAVVGKW